MFNCSICFHRIGSERQYSIELKWNNSSKSDQQTESTDDDQRISSTASKHVKTKSNQLHTPSFAKRINIFSEASPFAALSQHSVMSDLYGSTNGSSNLLSVNSTLTKKSCDLDFNDLDDGFGSLSSVSLGSTYPLISNGVAVASSRCPFSTAAQTCNVLEMDYGTNFYRTHFRDFEHQNWLQLHEKYGPIVVSLRKERVKNSSSVSSSSSNRWRVIVRTTSLIPLRGTVSSLPSICLPNGSSSTSSLDNSRRSSNNGDSFNINSVRDVLTLVMPKNVCVSNFR